MNRPIKLFADIEVKDGYDGDVRQCEAGLHEDGSIVCVHSFGYYRLMNERAVDTDEALWLIQNHPHASHIKII